jgi:cyclic pyranopterin phosphate synthase
MLIDYFGRQITYLRISLTTNCNLRCVYCMPPGGIPVAQSNELLTNDEIVSIVRSAAAEGLQRVRLTGGEPLLRKELVSLVRDLAAVQGIQEVTLTTNGMHLERMAASLAEAGLKRVNISLDTLDAEKFRRVTRGGRIDRVFKGIAAAEEAGLLPIKINTVVVRGLNDGELLDLARLSENHPWYIRFIELMPVGNKDDWGSGFPTVGQRYFPVREMRERLAALNLLPVDTPHGSGPARTFRIPGAPGTVGFISPLGDHFCESCNRLRLTADGALRPCLLYEDEVPVRDALREGGEVIQALRKALACKPQGHALLKSSSTSQSSMAQIGG